MSKVPSTEVTVEVLLRNGREIFLTLELPRDEILETDVAITYIRKPEPYVREEHVIPRADLAYLHTRTLEPSQTPSPYRTLGKEAMAQPS